MLNISFYIFRRIGKITPLEKFQKLFILLEILKIDGTGNLQVTEMIMQESRTYLLDPFTFHWIKSGFLPWSWKLIQIEHSKLEAPSGYVPGKSFNSSRW